MKKIIVHVSQINIDKNGGMSRIEYYWREAFEREGYEFIHIGNKETGKLLHNAFFSYKAYRYYKKLKIKPAAFIVHEPSALFFVNKDIPVFIESHGIERRNWEYDLKRSERKISFKTKLLFPIWRLLQCDISLKKANKLMLTNSDDKKYAISRYGREEKDIFIFKNGAEQNFVSTVPDKFVVLLNGSWIERKGIYTLIKAAEILYQQNCSVSYLLIGTGKSENEVLQDWPKHLQDSVTVVSRFQSNEEEQLLNQASIVVLPSNFEGQPLSILQAMASGKCCITTNCCGQKDVIADNENGLLFEVEDAQKLAELISYCSKKPDVINKIGNNAKQSMKGRNWASVSNEVVDYVRSFS